MSVTKLINQPAKFKRILSHGLAQTVVLILATSLFLNAQQLKFVQQITPFDVADSAGLSFDLPFLGGLNSPVPLLLDWDGDQRNDLIIHESSRRIFWLKQDNSLPQHFVWGGELFEDLAIGNWFRLTDADGDGDPDLFTNNVGFLRYYQNVGDRVTHEFTGLAGQLRDTEQAFIRNDGSSLPAWFDIDNDGDQDLFIGQQTGRLYFYEHTGNSNEGIPGYRLITRQFSDLNIQTLGKSSLRHGANSLVFADVDADGDGDILWGDFYAASLVIIENTGSADSAVFRQEDIREQFPPMFPVMTGGFNVAAAGDVNGDFLTDLIIGVRGGANSFLQGLIENLLYFPSVESGDSLIFQPASQGLTKLLDFGQNSVPAICDLNGDGGNDLLIANQEDLASPDAANSRIISMLKNVGNSGALMRWTDGDLLKNDIRLNKNYVPAVADLDDDGDFDLLVGNWNGRVLFFENRGSRQQPDFQLVTSSFADIAVGNNAAPTLADLDGDDDPDLLVGSLQGVIAFYRNAGTAAVADFRLEAENLLGEAPGLFAKPELGDINGDGDADLLVGTESGGVFLFRNIGNAAEFEFVLDTDFHLNGYQRMAPVIDDVNGDQLPDIIAGTSGGGLLYYQNTSDDSIGLQAEPPAPDFGDIPVGGIVNLSISLFNNSPVPVVLESVAVDSGDGTAFKAETNITSMPAGSTGQLTVSFSPSTEGLSAARIAIAYSSSRTLFIAVTGNGTRNQLVTGLRQNYPNPFFNDTIIEYRISGEGLSGPDRVLTIYNMLGQKIRHWSLRNPIGAIRWDGRDGNRQSCAQGIYFARIRDAAGKADTIKIILLR